MFCKRLSIIEENTSFPWFPPAIVGIWLQHCDIELGGVSILASEEKA